MSPRLPGNRVRERPVGATGGVPWILFVFSALVAIGTANALWPVRRPWWLKLPSFNLGWFCNELPLHVLATTALALVLFGAFGAFRAPPGQVGAVLSAVSMAGLAVLAAAHGRARRAVAEALDELSVDGDPDSASDGRADRRWRRLQLLLPWTTWLTGSAVERVGNVVYATVAGHDLKLDVFRPASRPGGCPVLVEVHGGGWITGDRRAEGRPLMNRLAARGWVCVSVDYRVGRHATWPDHIVDVNTALAWVREHVADFGGDPDFVCITGGSSGAHLAVLATLAPDEPAYRPAFGNAAAIRACVPFYGPYDFDNRLRLRAPAEMRYVERLVVRASRVDHPDIYERATPLARSGANAPPLFVIQGTSDNLVFPVESRAFVDHMRRTSHAPVLYAEIPRAHHAFDAITSLRTERVVDGVHRFLSRIHNDYRQVSTPNTLNRAE
jgi:acetyl esterase/lipase